MSTSKGWFNLEAAGGAIPETQFFEGDSAFKFLGLTRTQRLYGFIGWCAPPPLLFSARLYVASHMAVYSCDPGPCTRGARSVIYSLIAGFVLSLLGTILLVPLGLGTFALLYALGTIVSLIGTGFLIGFTKQLKLMFKPVRIVATIFFLASIVLIFVGAFVIRNDLICIIFVIIEYLAYAWYNLSYIPYARTAVLKVFGM
ncbi:SFT2-domain-containing protein [Cubamyces sp. BRFM 1775]|nr:SFT2-domain-containing protein [Cubamyces sp. BRFM 1775]